MVSFCFLGGGDKAEPVTADSESEAYTNENGYPIDQTSGTGDTSGEIVEAEKPVEEGNGMIGEDTDMTGDEYHEQLEQAEEEANKADQNLNESTGIEIVEELDKTMYAQQNCNSRSGDGTNYDKVASIEKGAQLHVTGRTSNDWYRVEWGDGVVYIAGSLLGDTAPTTPQTTTPSSPAGGNEMEVHLNSHLEATVKQPSQVEVVVGFKKKKSFFKKCLPK